MMKNLIKFCLPVGMLVSVCYLIAKRFVTIPDPIAIPICLFGIALMLMGLIYQGRRSGKLKKTK